MRAGARGLVLVCLGGLLVLLAVLLPTVIEPSLETVPADPDATTVLTAQEARFLDIDTQRPVTVDLTLTTHTTQWLGGEPAPDGVAQWASNTTIVSDDGLVRSETWEVSAFDARTGLAVDCCEGFRVDDTGRSIPIQRSGVVLKFPFRTQPEDIEVWDAALGATVTAVYEGEDRVDGVAAYRFRTEVPATEVGTSEVPAPLVGIDSIVPVEATTIYEGGRTVWVEPNTGGILDVEQRVLQTLTYRDTEVVAVDATFEFTDQTRAEAVDQLRQGVQLKRMRTTYPIVVGALGALAVAFGLRRRRRAARTSRAASDR